MQPTGRFLLDTNVVIALLEGDQKVMAMLERAPEVFIPAIVLGELFFGAAKSVRRSENAARVERFAAGTPDPRKRLMDCCSGSVSRPSSGYAGPALRRSSWRAN
jgi:hypothetical protein